MTTTTEFEIQDAACKIVDQLIATAQAAENRTARITGHSRGSRVDKQLKARSTSTRDHGHCVTYRGGRASKNATSSPMPTVRFGTSTPRPRSPSHCATTKLARFRVER